MISTEVNNVSDTKIFCAPNANGSRQITIYSNKVDNISKGNAMVLPVPNPESLQFHDLSRYQQFFDDCKSCFTTENRSYSLNYNSIDSAENLSVFKVGSYLVSVAKNLQQVEMADKKIFILSPELKEVLSMYYYQPFWGFIICRLEHGTQDYHPFAYSHNIIGGKIYVPTRHYHKTIDWTQPNYWDLGLRIGFDAMNPISSKKWNESNIDKSPMFTQGFSNNTTPETFGWFGNGKKSGKINKDFEQENKSKSNEIADDWSHEIYLYNINPYTNKFMRKMNSSEYTWDNSSIPNITKINFPFGKCSNFEKIIINGTHPNIDLVF
jgi:hypothetical protein